MASFSFSFLSTAGMVRSLKRRQNRVFIVQIKIFSSEKKLMSKINSTHRKPSAEDETPRRQLAEAGGGG